MSIIPPRPSSARPAAPPNDSRPPREQSAGTKLPWAAQVDRGRLAGQVGFSLPQASRSSHENEGPKTSQEDERHAVSPRGPNIPQQQKGRAHTSGNEYASSSAFEAMAQYQPFDRPSSPAQPRPRWYGRVPSWSGSSLSSSSFSSSSSWSLGSPLVSSSTRPLSAAAPLALLRPTEDLQLYVRRATIGLFPFPALGPQKSARSLLEQSYEALHPTRLSFPRLERVERFKEKDWAKDVRLTISALPAQPFSCKILDGPFFRLTAAGFETDAVQYPALGPSVAGTSFWLNEQVLLTALTILDITRPTRSDYEFCKVTTVLPAERIGDGVYSTSPYPSSKAQTLALLNRNDTADRVLIVQIVEPEHGLLSEFVKPDEDWELGVPFRDRRREMRPAPSKVHANLLQAHIFASCRENRVSHFVLTDTREFVFGQLTLAPALHRDFEDPLAISQIGRGRVVGVEVGAQATADFGRVGAPGTEGVMLVKKPMRFSAQGPSVFESLVHFIIQAFDDTREERATGVNMWTPPPPLPPKVR